jgi:phosphoribosylamine--glycine ligase
VKLLVLDNKNAHALDFCIRAQRAKHEVRWFFPESPKNDHIGKGLVPIVRELPASLAWADLVFLTDNTTYLHVADQARKDGVAVFGPTVESAEWELDRNVGMQVLDEAGIEVPAYEEFTDYDKAIEYVRKHDRPFVSKPSGSDDKALSYVAKSPIDLIYMLERWKKSGKLDRAPFILQEKIEGIEMAVGGWIGPDGWIAGWCENWEHKKLCNDNLGCTTGEQGTVLRHVKKSRLAKEMLEPLTEAIIATGHTGYVDVNCIIDDRGQPWPLEFTMRPGWPTMQIQQSVHNGDCVPWMMDLLDGQDSFSLSLDTIAIGVVLSVPDYPYSHLTRKEVIGIPVYNLTTDLLPHLHPCEMMEAECPSKEGAGGHAKMLATAGDYVLVMTGTGTSVKEAQKAVYGRLQSLIIPNSPMWRTDIGNRLRKELPKLQANRFAMGMSFRPAPERPSSTGSPTGRSTSLTSA